MLVAFGGLTVQVLTSPLPVILDNYVHDDSFYYLKTAENFAKGRGSSFDGINYTNGYQPAWFLALAALHAAGVGHDAMASTAIALQAVLFAIGIYLVVSALVAAGIDALWAVIATGIVFCAFVPVLGWNLLESGVTLVASAAMLRAFIGVEHGKVDASRLGIIVSLAALARTDHLIYVAVCAAWLALRSWRISGRLIDTTAVLFSVPVIVLIGGYLTLNLVTTGHLMPVSGLTKSTVFGGWSLSGMIGSLLHIDVRQSWKLGLLTALMLVARDYRRRELTGVGIYAVGALAIAAYYLLSYSPTFSQSAWYYVPHYILFSYGISEALRRVGDLLPASVRSVATAMAIALMLLLISGRAWLMTRYVGRGEGERAAIYRVAGELRELLRSGDRVGAWDAGILGYYGGAVTNLDGLINSMEYYEQYLSHGRTADYIRDQGFQYIACVVSDTLPGGGAYTVLDLYSEVYRGQSWVILKRRGGATVPG